MGEILVQVVDEDDVPLGGASKQEIWESGLRHRVARVMVEDEQGNILIQKRVANTALFPGCWDNSAAGHVDVGENHLAAAKRELAEEIGIKNVELIAVKHYKTDGTFGTKILKRWSGLYKVVVPRSTALSLQKEEVTAARWVSPQELGDIVSKHPNSISDGLLEAYEIMYKQ